MKSSFQSSITIPTPTGEFQHSTDPYENPVFGKYLHFNQEQLNALIHWIHVENNDCVWITLDKDDQEPGRFWIKWIAATRKIVPGVGKDILNSLIDHHSKPLPESLKKFSQELGKHKLVVVMMNIQFLLGSAWWQSMKEWLDQQRETLHWMGVEMQEGGNDSGMNSSDILALNACSEQNEWLLELEWLVAQKEYERAGDILENLAESWLDDGLDALELLFWLREIPGVLLTSRPVLCWLAGNCSYQLQLPLLVNYYSNAAEHSLRSLSRFSRNSEQWLHIEINENGETVGALLEKLERIKQNH